MQSTATKSVPRLISLNKGLDLPVQGAPEQKIYGSKPVESVALMGRDYIWRRGTMLVSEGDRVIKGQAVVRDKTCPEIIGVAPGSGVVEAIHQGSRRMLETFVIRLDDHHKRNSAKKTVPPHLRGGPPVIEKLNAGGIKQILLESGLWPMFRTRPFGTLADPHDQPKAVFINAMESDPLAPDPAVIIEDAKEDFYRGLAVIARLFSLQDEVPVYLCKAPGLILDHEPPPSVEVVSFAGPHPAGLVGTHIHYLAPVGRARMVWYTGYQDLISVGRYFYDGRRSMQRVVSLAGPPVKNPRLIRTRIGACTNDLVQGELDDVDVRVISGSILSGYHASGTGAWLGRYHNQISVLREDRRRHMFKYLRPGSNLFSVTGAFLSRFFPARRFPLTTSQNGSPRAMVPIGTYERVMPLDILITLLLRAIMVGDTETAVDLGVLELEEEDLALCSFVDPGKFDYGPLLRQNLWNLFKER